jgi:hypothetical protein
LNLKVWAAWQYWPDTCRIDGNHGEVALSGDITARLSFDIFLASEDLLKMELAGETGFELEGSWAFEQQPYGMLVGQWRGLDALVEIRVLWGIVEYKRTWEVWHPNVRFQYRLEPGAGGD